MSSFWPLLGQYGSHDTQTSSVSVRSARILDHQEQPASNERPQTSHILLTINHGYGKIGNVYNFCSSVLLFDGVEGGFKLKGASSKNGAKKNIQLQSLTRGIDGLKPVRTNPSERYYLAVRQVFKDIHQDLWG